MSKYDYSSTVIPVFIEKQETYIEAFPTQWSAEAANANGYKIVFNVESTYPADLFNAELEATIVLQSAANTIFTDQDSVLINNFFPAMFERIGLELNDEKMEEVDDPYISSSILKFITKSQDYLSSDGQVEGFILDNELYNTSAITNTGREFRKILYNSAPTRSIRIKYKLADLFRFCAEYRKALYKIPIRITLTRRFDDEANKFLFHTAVNVAENQAAVPPVPAVVNKVGRAWLQDIVLRIPTHELNSESSVDFLSQFNGKKEIDMLFNGISMYKGELQGNGNKTILITTATQPPELVVLLFRPQTYDYTDNSGLFETGDIESIELRIGNTQKYPDKPLTINATEFYYQDLYKHYSDTCKIYGNEPLLSYYEFMKNYPMYVFSTQKQDRDVFSSGASINIYVKKTSATAYSWHVLYLENKWYKSKLFPNGMSRPTQVTFNSK